MMFIDRSALWFLWLIQPFKLYTLQIQTVQYQMFESLKMANFLKTKQQTPHWDALFVVGRAGKLNGWNQLKSGVEFLQYFKVKPMWTRKNLNVVQK